MIGLAWMAPALLLSAQVQPARVPDSARHAVAEYARRAAALGVSGVVLLADGDDVLMHAALGWRDPDRHLPNDTASLFYIASLSKQFVAAAVLLLEQEGRLRTSDPISTVLAGVPPDKRSITIGDLMHHRSGLPRYGFDLERRDWAVETREQSTRGILATPLQGRPGAGFSYENSNYILLTAIVEQVAGRSIESFLEQRFFRPAGMRDTYAGGGITPALQGRVVWSLGDHSEAFTILDRPLSYLRMGRGVVTTAGDLYRWLRALGSGRILSEASRRRLFAIGAEIEPGYGYGGGWFIRADSTGAPRLVFHRGDLGGYRSEARLSLPSGRIGIVLTNASARGRSLTETLLNDLSGIGFRGAANPLPPVLSGDLKATPAVAGEYRNRAGDLLDITALGGRLLVAPGGQRAVDWLLRSDTAGWEGRQRVMDASMALIDRLKRGETPRAPGGKLLAPNQLQDLALEWKRLASHGGRLKSYQRLGAVPDEAAGATVAIVRLVFARDSLLLGIGWANDTLAYTYPEIGNLVSPSFFAPLRDGRWASYDWGTGSARYLRFERRPGTGFPEAVTLETSNGSIRFSRREG